MLRSSHLAGIGFEGIGSERLRDIPVSNISLYIDKAKQYHEIQDNTGDPTTLKGSEYRGRSSITTPKITTVSPLRY